MILRLIAVVLCVLGPLTCAAQGGSIDGEASYVSFSVPGSDGTYPMSINSSMTVTGYYYVAHITPTVVRGFVRDADGAITTFDVGGLDRPYRKASMPPEISPGSSSPLRWVRRATRGRVEINRKAFSGMPTATRSSSSRACRPGTLRKHSP